MKWNQVSVEEMEQRVARFEKREVIPLQKILPPELNRELVAEEVYGVVTSNTENDPQNFFDTAPIVSGVDGVAVSIVSCPANQGPGIHVHQHTYENFMPLSGEWRIFWGDSSEHHIDLNQWDMISIPPGTMRRFENLANERSHMLVLVYSNGKVDNDIYIPPEEIARLRKQFGGEYGALLDRIEREQPPIDWSKS